MVIVSTYIASNRSLAAKKMFFMEVVERVMAQDLFRCKDNITQSRRSMTMFALSSRSRNLALLKTTTSSIVNGVQTEPPMMPNGMISGLDF